MRPVHIVVGVGVLLLIVVIFSIWATQRNSDKEREGNQLINQMCAHEYQEWGHYTSDECIKRFSR